MEKTNCGTAISRRHGLKRKQQAVAGQRTGDSGFRNQEDNAYAYEWLDDIGDPQLSL